MSDFASTETPGRRGGLLPIALLLLLAFVIGVAVTGYLVRNVGWFGRIAEPRIASRAAPVLTPPDNYVPPEGQSATGAIDTSVLQTREATLAAQIAALEARAATLSTDAAAAGLQAGRAEAVLTVAAARRALDRGQPLGYLEVQLRTRFAASQPRAVAIVTAAARQPVTLEDLRQGLDAIAPDVTTGASDGWAASLRRELGSLIVLRRAGTPSPLPADRMTRARRLVEMGQVEAARAEIARLPGAKDAANWQDAAERYILARRALDILEYSALNAPPIPAAPASAPAAEGDAATPAT